MNSYYIILDTTKEYGSIHHAQFITERTGNDILGHILAFAKERKTKFDNIRLIEFETKKQYDTCYKNWLDKVAETERQNKQGGNI